MNTKKLNKKRTESWAIQKVNDKLSLFEGQRVKGKHRPQRFVKALEQVMPKCATYGNVSNIGLRTFNIFGDNRILAAPCKDRNLRKQGMEEIEGHYRMLRIFYV